MLFHGFIHGDNEIFRSNVSQFVNDTTTHPIVKYKAFIVAFLLITSGLLILLLFNGERIFGHSYWKHLFIPVSGLRDRHRSYIKDVFDYDYDDNKTDAAIFREAIEGMTSSSSSSSSSPTTTKDGKATTKTGEFISSDKESAEKNTASKKKTPCATDCGKYIELKGKINELTKYVNAVKDQKDEIKQTGDKLQELGKQIEDLNKSLSPGGQVNIKIE
jgi:hypothetical protein